ncbi:MAG: methyl-accepting chemotaxis protein, partial [Treponema sp.]|nr:methyl-accepting chemotaxis protein [Treponema sp.]
MKLRYRLIIIIAVILVAAVLSLSLVLLGVASSIQMVAALESQERLAAEQARVIQIRYETSLQIARTLADAMSDYGEVELGGQRSRFDQFIHSIIASNE